MSALVQLSMLLQSSYIFRCPDLSALGCKKKGLREREPGGQLDQFVKLCRCCSFALLPDCIFDLSILLSLLAFVDRLSDFEL